MNKRGVTLITLSIIGIAAALIAPSLRKLIPDREKVEFMENLEELLWQISWQM